MAKQKSETFGQWLRRQRKARQYTLRQLAEVAGLSHVQLGNYEREMSNAADGRPIRPSEATVATLSKIFSVPLSEVRERAGYAPNPTRTDDEAIVLAYYADLPPAKRREVFDIIKVIHANQMKAQDGDGESDVEDETINNPKTS